MNELDPALKRLLKWTREASPPRPEAAPLGFSSRVLASGRRDESRGLLQELQQTAWSLACGSLALIICGALILVSQRSSPPQTEEFSSALSFLASNFTR